MMSFDEALRQHRQLLNARTQELKNPGVKFHTEAPTEISTELERATEELRKYYGSCGWGQHRLVPSHEDRSGDC